MQYPYQDDRSSFTPERLADWEQVIDDVNDLFGAHAREDEDFVVSLSCPDGVSVDLNLVNPGALTAATVMEMAITVRENLRKRAGYWRVRVWLDGRERPADTCLWLEIDPYLITPWRGMQVHERFTDSDAMRTWFWGAAGAAPTTRT